MFSVELNGTGTAEQDYRLEPCKPVSPLTLPYPRHCLKLVCWGHCGLADWAIYIVNTKYKFGFPIVLREILRRGHKLLSMLAPCVTLVSLVFHSCIANGQKYVYFLNTKIMLYFGFVWWLLTITEGFNEGVADVQQNVIFCIFCSIICSRLTTWRVSYYFILTVNRKIITLCLKLNGVEPFSH